MPGSVFKRCGCRHEDGSEMGAGCPRLSSSGHGTWYYKAELPGGPDGRRKRARRGGFATRREAEAALTDLLDRVNKRTHVDAGRQTVGAYLEQWLAGKAALRSTTARSYREHLDLYLLPTLGHLRLTDLNETDVDAMYAAMRLLGKPGAPITSNPELMAILAARKSTDPPRPLSAARLRRIHATLRSALNTAVKRRLIAYNPALHVELATGTRPRAVVWTDARTDQWRTWRDRERELREELVVAERKLRRAPRRANRAKLQDRVDAARTALATHSRSYSPPVVSVWTPAQTGAFLDSIADDRLYALFHLIAFRGLRRGEAVGLPWINVDLEHGQVVIASQIVQLGWVTEQAAPKSDSEGVVALDGGTIEVLRAHQERQRAEAAAHPSVWQDTGLVFTREDGSPLHPDLVSRTFDRMVRDADLPPIRLHDLRHGAATLALAGGADLKIVSAMLRHSSITITADTYTSVLPETARAAAEAAVAIVPRKPRESRPVTSGPAAPAPHRPHKGSEDDSGPSLQERKPRSDGVRRQGLEPRTRGLRVRCSAN